jgi:phosphatidate phosphatase APP1
VVGEKEVRRGTTHTIQVQVVRGDNPIEGARVFIDIEDYGEDIIKEFDGYTNSQGYFILSWEIPQSFDDIETLLAFIDVTDGQSSKTELFKFQVYCLPGEKDCKAEGN